MVIKNQLFYIAATLQLLFMTVPAFAEDDIRFITLDVGEGQALLVLGEERGILIDTGSFAKGYEVVSSLRQYGVNKLDGIMLTHLHPDHASAIFILKHNYPQAVVYETNHRLPFDPHRDAYRWVTEALDEKSWEVRTVLQGESIDFQGAKLDILWPVAPVEGTLNSQSMVIHLHYDDKNILIMGDVDISVEKKLLEKNLLPRNVDVVVVGHHGANDTSHQEFIDWVKPGVAVISINGDNVRGYPDKQVIQRWQQSGAMVHLTYEKGDLVF